MPNIFRQTKPNPYEIPKSPSSHECSSKKKLNEGICQSEQHSNEFSMNIYFIGIEIKKIIFK